MGKDLVGSLLEHALVSVASIRKYWSQTVPIIIVHHHPIREEFKRKFDGYDVCFQKVEFPQNLYDLKCKFILKYGFLHAKIDTDFFLFLDCDTEVCGPLEFDVTKDLNVHYENTTIFGSVTKKELRVWFERGGVEFDFDDLNEQDKTSHYREFLDGKNTIFPLYNSGVIFGKTEKIITKDNITWMYKFFNSFALSFSSRATNRIDEIAFLTLVLKLNLNVGILPWGYHIMGDEKPEIPSDEKKMIYHYLGKSPVLNIEKTKELGKVTYFSPSDFKLHLKTLWG